MNFPNRLGGGCGQSASNRGFQEIEPICKPGPNFDSFSRDQLIGTDGVIFAVPLFVCLSGFFVWFALGEKVLSVRSHHQRGVDLNFYP